MLLTSPLGWELKDGSEEGAALVLGAILISLLGWTLGSELGSELGCILGSFVTKTTTTELAGTVPAPGKVPARSRVEVVSAPALTSHVLVTTPRGS